MYIYNDWTRKLQSVKFLKQLVLIRIIFLLRQRLIRFSLTVTSFVRIEPRLYLRLLSIFHDYWQRVLELFLTKWMINDLFICFSSLYAQQLEVNDGTQPTFFFLFHMWTMMMLFLFTKRLLMTRIYFCTMSKWVGTVGISTVDVKLFHIFSVKFEQVKRFVTPNGDQRIVFCFVHPLLRMKT